MKHERGKRRGRGGEGVTRWGERECGGRREWVKEGGVGEEEGVAKRVEGGEGEERSSEDNWGR